MLSLAPQSVAQEQAAPAAVTSEPQQTEYFGGSAPLRNDVAGTDTGLRYDPRRGLELGFVDADVRRVIDAILGDTLRVDYTVDPGVQGTITLRSARPVARASLIPALEAALSTVDAAIVRIGSVYQVVPRQAAQATASLARPLTAQERSLPGFALEIVPLRYASAREVQRVVEGSGAKEVILQIDEARSHIIIAGSSQERAAVRRLISSIDIDWVRGMNFAFYKLESVAPDEIIADLTRIFVPPLDVLGSRVRLVPLPRLRAVLGIAADREDLRRMESWIKRLDAGAGADRRKLFVYNVQNDRAVDLASSLRQVVSGGLDEAPGPTIATSAASTSERDDQQPARQNGTVFAGSTPGGDKLRIVPNEENNSLLIFATPTEYAFLEDALAKIDVPPRQVLIEMILAEVTLTKDLRYGLQWFFSPGDNEITLSTNSSGNVASQFPGFSYLYSGATDARVVLNAIQSKTNVRVLSSPKLVVLNNQTATLQVGDQVPIVTQTSQNTTAPGAPIVNSVELRDTGVILTVTPRVNDSGLVIMDVAQEVSDVSPTTSSGIDSPTIQQRKLTSTVATRSGSTVALGGLIRNNVTRGRSGIPLLADLPLIGNLFRTTTDTDRRTELIILLTPTLMRDTRETAAVVDEFIEGFSAVRPLIDEGRRASVPGRRGQ